MSYSDLTNENMDRGRFRDHYTNEVTINSTEKNYKLIYEFLYFSKSMFGLKRIMLLMWVLNTTACQEESIISQVTGDVKMKLNVESKSI